MRKYSVKIAETLVREVDIVANDRYDALNKIKARYYNSEIVLGCEDMCDVEFNAREKGYVRKVSEVSQAGRV